MPITWRYEYMLVCDGECGTELILDNIDIRGNLKRPTSKTFKRIAIKDGWKIEGNKCWCPKCKK